MTRQRKDPASSASPGVLEAEIKERGKDSKPVKPRKEREARVPEHLPAVDEVIEPEEVTAAPEAWRHIGEEVTEQLDYQPARFLRRRIIRRKYVKRDEPHLAPIIAALNTLQERSIAAPGLLAQIIVAKYCDHLPLYRQEQIYATRHDIHIPRQSMARWLGLAADWLRPVYEHIHTGVMAGGYVQIDETPVENAIRPTAIGKKNWLFIGEAEAGQRSAILFTIIEACRSRGIDLQTYLRYVLTRLPTMTNRQTKDVTPAAWIKAQEPTDQRQAA